MAPKAKPKRKDKCVKERGFERKNGEDSLTKEEKAVATYVRFNCPSKTTLVAGNEVHYFKASDAIECLQQSKWSTGKRRTTVIFNSKAHIVDYMNGLLEKGLFWRAKKLVPKKKEKKEEDKGEGSKEDEAETSKPKGEEGTPRKRGKKAEKAEKDTGAEATEDPDREDAPKKDDDDKKEKKKKKKVKLDWSSEQVFKDSGTASDVYVWHFDPHSWTRLLIGAAIMLGSIGVCLFPLWPPWVRLGVYYLSVGAMVLVGVLIGLIFLRTIVFGAVWLGSMGKHHLWILPNLTEDCGFFESFKPAYDYKYYPSKKDKEDADRRKKAEKEAKEKDSDEEEEENPDGVDEEESEQSGTEASAPGTPDNSTLRQRKGRGARDDFEMVDPEETPA